MKAFTQLFFKPKWQHKDASVRAEAVAHANAPELIAQLPSIAREDESARVRLAALRRLDEIGLLLDRSNSDPDPDLRQTARNLLLHALIDGKGKHDLGRRIAAFEACSEPDIIESVAARAPESELRRIALARITRQGLLGDRALAESDPALRLFALERIDQPATLERVARESRTRDKRLHKRAKEMVEAIQSAGGDPELLERNARTLCEQLESMMRQALPENAARADEIERSWAQLPEAVRNQWHARFEGSLRVVRDGLRPKPEPVAAPVASNDADAVATDQAAEPTVVESEETSRPALRDLSADVDSVRSAVSTLINQLETISPEPETAFREYERLAKQWAVLGSRGVETEHGAEIEQALERAGQSLRDTARNASKVDEATDAPAESSDALTVRGSVIDTQRLDDLERRWKTSWHRPDRPSAAALAAKVRFDASLASARSEASRDEERIRVIRRQIDMDLDRLEAALDRGVLSEARDARASIEKHHQEAGRDLAPSARLSAADERIEKLAQWQRWSHNELRKRLCDEVEALLGQGLHPDALATRIKDLQTEFKRVDTLEGLDEQAARNHGLARRFRALCHQAMKPARAFFDKRSEIRGKALEQVQPLVEKLEAESSEDAELHSLAGVRSRALDTLRELEALDPRQRAELGKRLRAVADRCKKRLDQSSRDVEKVKQRLVEQATALASKEDLREAISEAKQLQQRWKEAGRGGRKTDERQWAEFRAACDAVFARLDERRDSENRARDERNASARALCDAYATQLANDALDASELTSLQRQMRDQLRALESDSPEVHKQFEAHEATIRARLDALKAAQAERGRAALRERLDCVRRIENGEAQAQDLAALPSAGAWLDQALAARLTLDAQPTAEHVRRAAEIAVSLESIAGIESPAESQTLRREIQVRRLSERMSGDARSPEDEVKALLLEWLALPLDAESSQQHRVLAAWERN